MRSLLAVPAAIGVLALVAACGSGSGGGSQGPSTSLPPSASTAHTPIFPAGPGPAGGHEVVQGPASIVVSSGFEQQGDPAQQSKSTSVSFVSSEQAQGKRVAIVVSWSNGKDAKTAKQEAQAFRGQLLDVEHVGDLRMVRVSWPGLHDAYQFAYTDHNVTPAAKTLVLMGESASGQYVSVTAKSPAALVQSQHVAAVCGSLRLHGASSTT